LRKSEGKKERKKERKEKKRNETPLTRLFFSEVRTSKKSFRKNSVTRSDGSDWLLSLPVWRQRKSALANTLLFWTAFLYLLPDRVLSFQGVKTGAKLLQKFSLFLALRL
jgi:hypothetical protein